MTQQSLYVLISRSDEQIETQPSPAAEGNLGFSPTLIEPSSPLPGLTPLAPIWDLPSAATAGEGGRQPTDYDSHDESGGMGDSRNPIAPPMTSLEGDTMIYSAGTTQDCIGMMGNTYKTSKCNPILKPECKLSAK